MEMMGQGLVLMVAGMGIVYAFLYVLILVTKFSSRFVSHFDSILPDTETKKAPRRQAAAVQSSNTIPAADVKNGIEVKAPVPGTVLRLTAADGQNVAEGDEILVMDVMKMETPITAPCAGTVSIRVAVMDKVATGDVVAMVG